MVEPRSVAEMTNLGKGLEGLVGFGFCWEGRMDLIMVVVEEALVVAAVKDEGQLRRPWTMGEEEDWLREMMKKIA